MSTTKLDDFTEHDEKNEKNIVDFQICRVTQKQKRNRMKLRYENWKGKNVFLCSGGLMLGVHIEHLCTSISLITLTWMAYIFFLAPFTHIPECTVLAIILFFINLLFLFGTAFTEPGIIPRQKSIYSIPQEMTSIQQYCSTCRIIRSNRTKHCRHCDNCVTVFDHHCPWTGTCIGVRNYPFFFLFVLSIFLGSFYILFSSIYVLIGVIKGLPSDTAILRLFSCIIIFFWSFFIFVIIGILLFFHIYLIYKNLTTSEFLKGNLNQHNKNENEVITQNDNFSCLTFLYNNPKSNISYFCCGIQCFCCYDMKNFITPTLLLPMWRYDNEINNKENLIDNDDDDYVL